MPLLTMRFLSLFIISLMSNLRKAKSVARCSLRRPCTDGGNVTKLTADAGDVAILQLIEGILWQLL